MIADRIAPRRALLAVAVGIGGTWGLLAVSFFPIPSAVIVLGYVIASVALAFVLDRRRTRGEAHWNTHRGTVALVAPTCFREARAMRPHRYPCPAPTPRSAFAGYRFPPEVIALAVRWYLRFGLSYRDVEELLAERGVKVDHVTVYRWV